MVVIGWDVGGAHLKAARIETGHEGEGRPVAALLRPSPLWQGLDHLDAALEAAGRDLGADEATAHAVTMTGELADIFPSRREGVRALAARLTQKLAAHGPAPLFFYAGEAGFLAAPEIAGRERLVASANWHASAALAAARFGTGLFIDIGSTTTDLIPFRDGRVIARGADDASRLAAGELVYTGIARSFALALAPRVPVGGAWVPMMGEYFATAADLHRLRGELPAGADVLPAADGGAKTEAASAARLARMIGRDAEDLAPEALRELALYLAESQLRQIFDGAAQVLSAALLPPAAPLVGAGVGRFLLPRLAARLERPLVMLFAEAPFADHAPAAAVALLLAARMGQALRTTPSFPISQEDLR